MFVLKKRQLYLRIKQFHFMPFKIVILYHLSRMSLYLVFFDHQILFDQKLSTAHVHRIIQILIIFELEFSMASTKHTLTAIPIQ